MVPFPAFLLVPSNLASDALEEQSTHNRTNQIAHSPGPQILLEACKWLNPSACSGKNAPESNEAYSSEEWTQRRSLPGPSCGTNETWQEMDCKGAHVFVQSGRDHKILRANGSYRADHFSETHHTKSG